ncbi:MAG: tetratricopeptide repeat protein [Burkholderiales bacterium]
MTAPLKNSTFKLLTTAILLAVIAAALQSRTLFSPPIFDDKMQLTVEQIFTQYAHLFSAQTRWLSYGTFAWTAHWIGANWLVFHVQNVVLHGMVVASLFVFLYRLFQTVLAKDDQSKSRYRLMAAGGALFFGLHPATVYAVSYLIQRSIVMATLFSVLSLWCLLEARIKKNIGWYMASALLYLLAVSSKEHAILLPAVGAAMLYLIHPPSDKINPTKLWAGIAILFLAVLSVAYFFIEVLGGVYAKVLGGAFDQASIELIKMLSANYPVVAQHTYLLSVINESFLFFKYLILWIFPNPNWMAVDMRVAFPTSLAQWPQVLGPLLFLGYAAIALNLLRKRKELGLLGFALITPSLLFPTELASVWIQDPFVIYRSYLWMWPLGAAIPAMALRIPPKILAIGGALVLVILVAASWNRLATFKSEQALWGDAIRYNSGQAQPGILGRERSYNEHALAMAETGGYDQAVADYTDALQINPNDANVYSNRAAIYLLIGKFDKAQADISEALRLEPSDAKALYNQGALYMQEGRNDEALKQFTDMISRGVGVNKNVYGMRAVIYLKQGKTKEALADLNQAIALDPNYYDAYMNRGTANGMLGHVKEALTDFDQAITLNPNSADAHVNRGIILINQGHAKEALLDADNAITVAPENTKAHLLRAQIFLSLGRVQDALREYEVILHINPKEAMAYLNRGEVYLFLKDIVAAKRDLTQACQLGLQAACTKLAATGT